MKASEIWQGIEGAMICHDGERTALVHIGDANNNLMKNNFNQKFSNIFSAGCQKISLSLTYSALFVRWFVAGFCVRNALKIAFDTFYKNANRCWFI